MAVEIKKILETKQTDSTKLEILLWIILAIFIYTFISNAWIGDDAYITFRTVDNFVNGYGLTWNTSERVQSYTHPLWMFIHSMFYAITGNIYITTIFLSFVFSFMAVYLMMFKIAANKMNAIAGAVLLIISKIFIDYTSSGLENPLTYFLVILFLIYYFKENEAKRKIFTLSLITALALLNRMDTVLLFLPALIFVAAKNWKLKHLLYIFYGFTPFIIWEIFSIIYYGFPFPNTYYSKLNTGIPINEYISQGFSYYANFLKNDLMSAVVIFGGLIFIFIYADKLKTRNVYMPLAFGIILYLIYILRIGGDFMSGRFFTAPFFMITSILVSLNLTEKKKIYSIAIASILIILSCFTSYHPLMSNSGFGTDNGKRYDQKVRESFLNIENGINEERGIYYPDTGLLRMILNGTTTPTMPIVKLGQKSRHSKIRTIVQSMIGMIGFYAGPKIYIIDQLALPDPFLSKLNSSENPDWDGKWRIGHFYRKMPSGYFKTIETGVNQIESESLNMFYEKIKLITRGDIFSLSRFSEILRINTGYYDEIRDIKYKSDDEPKLFAGDKLSFWVYKIRLGNYYVINGQFEKAIQEYKFLAFDKKYLDEATKVADIFFKLATLYLQNSKYDSAMYYSKEGIKYAQNKEDSLSQLELCLKVMMKKGDNKNAIDIAEQMLRISPSDLPSLNNLAKFKYENGLVEEAIELWKKILIIDPNNQDINYNLYAVYFNKNQFDSASIYAPKVIENGGHVNMKRLEDLKRHKK